MPKIPDFEQLGSRPTPTPQRSVYGYTPGIIADAQLEQAKDLGRISQTIDKGLKEENDAAEKLQLAQSESAFYRARAQAITDASNDPDYANVSKKYNETISKSVEDISQNIQNPQIRELFKAKLGEHIATGQLHVDGIAESKRKDAGRASVLSTVDQNLEALWNASPEEREKIIHKTKEVLWLAGEANILTRAEAVKEQQNFSQRYAIGMATKESTEDARGFLQRISQAKLSPTVQNSIQSASDKYGVSASYLARVAQLESSGDPNAANGSSEGLYGFMPGTAEDYGLKNRRDPNESSDAAARMTLDNRKFLLKSLGREPTEAELYLAHQQGASGAAALIKNPDAKAVDVLAKIKGSKASAIQSITQNDGNVNMTAQQFAGKWDNKYSGNTKTYFDTLDPQHQLHFRNMAQKTLDAQEKAYEASLKESQEADLKTQITNEISVKDVIDDPKTTIDEKITNINKLDLTGQIRPTFAEEARRYLTSTKKLGAKSDPQIEADIIERIYDLNAISEEDEKEYLSGLRNIKQDIMKYRTDGKLSADGQTKLENQLRTLTSNKKSQATVMMSSSFGEASKLIKSSLPPEYRGQAIRELFYETSGEEQDKLIKSKDKKEIRAFYKERVHSVIDNINKKRRDNALEVINNINSPLPKQTVPPTKNGKPAVLKKDAAGNKAWVFEDGTFEEIE